MNKGLLISFLLRARTQTYASGGGKVESLLAGAKQLEYVDGDWLYRDIYTIGNGIFPGIETIYIGGTPMWSMSYFGDFTKMTEAEADLMLRKALLDNWDTTRIWKSVYRDYGEYQYTCRGRGTVDCFQGDEIITRGGKDIYTFQYAGGIVGKLDEITTPDVVTSGEL